ncbi:hypothetical protein HNO88_001601 [Novosphingobium chloroacetimidivorans]|uniref:Uncharacterized protein n=1 Tax=Novosphingobium chloroacetimidivorans TaxID=1428314 RepID=A0A7W7K8N3_9SPHN|nr:hypothetical protein [Novosphingobium chloroacetimidivorans]MBB4858282.1 hypothetical protein [Novosphingobium chloroacetimidivorans]
MHGFPRRPNAMSLNKIVADAIEANEAAGVIDRHNAINAAMPQILADEELTEMCVRSHLSKVIASNVKKRRRERGKTTLEQNNLFGLMDAHPIGDSEGFIKRTEALTRAEFREIIRIRQDQVTADLTYLKRLRDAELETRAVWDRHPDWTWGQVEAEYSRQHAKAA